MTKIIVAADLNHYNNDQMNRVYSPKGIAPAAIAVSGGGREIKIMTNGGDGLKKVTVNDFFAGCGGMGLGFKLAGFEIAGAWDFDKYAVESYKHNVGDHVVQANILEMTHEDVPYADVWTFGAPCQAFSVAGKQLGMTFKCPTCKHEETFEGELIIDRQTFCSECGELSAAKDIRGIMFFEVMRLLKTSEEKPPVIMLENVKGVSKFLDVIAYEYEKRGYKLSKTLYNSKFWGVPQNRERYFIVGVHESIEQEFEFPIEQKKYIPRLSTILESEVDEKYYIDPEKTEKIIEQAREKVELDTTHAVITPDRVDKRQNGRRAKDEEEESYTLTAQDRHGVILKDNLHKCIDDQGRTKKELKFLDISPTIKAEEHGNNKKVVVHVKEATKKGYAEATIGDSINLSHPNSKTRRGREGKQVAQTLLTGQEQVVVEPKIISVGNTNPSGKGMNGNVIHENGISSTLTTNKGEGIKVMTSEGINVTKNGSEFHSLTEQSVTLCARDYKGLAGKQPSTAVMENSYRIRKLTVREYARLQSFPESYEIVVSNSQAYKQFGNAVTVNVAQAIAERIKMFLLSL